MASEKKNDYAGTDPVKANEALRRGSFHSKGVPGEESVLRAHMRVLKLSDENETIYTTRPIKGGLTAESTSLGRLEATTGSASGENSALYLLARKGRDQLETLVFCAGESNDSNDEDDSNDEEAVAIFTDLQKARQYIEAAGWEQTYEPAELTPANFNSWLRVARADGIAMLAVDVDRESHLRGEPQRVFFLTEQIDRPLEDVFRDMKANAIQA